MNANFKVTGLTRLGIKPKSTAPEADVLPLGHLSSNILVELKEYLPNTNKYTDQTARILQ